MSSRIPARARPRRRPAPAPEREHRRLLAGGDRGAPGARADDRRALSRLPPRSTTPAPPISASTRARLLLTNGLDEGMLAAAIAWLAARARRRARGGHRRAGASACMPTASRRPAGGSSRVPPRPRSRFRSRRRWRRITPRTRLVFVTSPGNPTGVLIARDDIRALARAVPAGRRWCFVDEAYAEFTDEHFLAELDAHPNVVVGRTFAKAQGLAGAAHRRRDRRCRRRSRACAGRCRRTASTSPRRRRSSRRSAIARISTGIARRCERSRALVYAACERLGPAVLARATPTSCWCASATDAPAHRRGAARARQSSCAIARRSRAAPAASASPPASSSTPKRASRALEEVLCAARVIDRKHHGDADPAEARASRARARYDIRTGIRFLDHMLELFARHGGFDLTVDGDGRPRRGPASHRRGPRHRARRGGVAGARQPPRHQPRRLFRHADGRDAGGGGHRSRRAAARRRSI